jgi:hypothetical protein
VNEAEAAMGLGLGGVFEGLRDRAKRHYPLDGLPEVGCRTKVREPSQHLIYATDIRYGGLARFDSPPSARHHRVMPLIETEEAARRLARAIASDLSLYNEDKIVGGIQSDNLFDSLAEEIEEGRALYKRRVSPDLYPRNFYDRALVDILIKAKGHIKSKLW